MTKIKDKTKAELISEIFRRREYEVNGKRYSREGILRLIESLIPLEKLNPGTTNALGKIREKMIMLGEDPKTYLPTIANAEDESKREGKTKPNIKRKTWGKMFVFGLSLLLYGCSPDKPKEETENTRCYEFSVIEQKALREGVDSNLVHIGKEYDALAHKIDEQLDSSTNINNIFRKRYSAYLGKSLELTSYKPLTNKEEALEFKIKSHEHVRKIGIDENSELIETNKENK